VQQRETSSLYLTDTTLSGALPDNGSMSNPANNHKIDYVEYASTDLAKTKEFFVRVFGWKFTDYGPDYTSFEDGRIAGGFFKADSVAKGGPLVVIYAADLEATEAQVKAAGGKIVKETFSFPGGRRFHFTEPSGNELSVWSE
jgi:uncharacterized protein